MFSFIGVVDGVVVARIEFGCERCEAASHVFI